MAAYVQDSFASQMEVKLQYSNGVVEVLGLFCASQNLFFAVVYRQPNDSAGGNRSTIGELKPAIDKLQAAISDIGEPTPNILICGDFNLPTHVWNKSDSDKGGSLNSYLDNFVNSNFLTQHITNPTHKDGNLLDLVFTNNDSILHSYDCIPPSLTSISDHFHANSVTIAHQ